MRIEKIINYLKDEENKNSNIMKISITNTQEYVIIGRNQSLSAFYIKPKSDFEKEIENYSEVISSIEGCYSESGVINMMSKSKFYTYSSSSYTKVIVVGSHIKSTPNGTTVDNLKNFRLDSGDIILKENLQYIEITFRNDHSRMNIEFISFRDSIGQMTSRVKLPIECDSLVLNLKNSLWSGIGLNKLDKIGFITPDHFRKSNFSNVNSIVVYIGGSSHIFKSNVFEDNVYFYSNLSQLN